VSGRRRCLALAVGLCLAVVAPAGAQVSSGLSTHGLPGLVNTPAAVGMPTGWAEFGLNNMTDWDYIDPERRALMDWQANFHFAFGFWDRLVIGGRGTEIRLKEPAPARLLRGLDGEWRFYRPWALERDTQANASLLLVRESSNRPALAVGVHDLGGFSTDFQGRYAVASKTVAGRARVSLGYGIGPDFLDGAFGGVELDLIPGRITAVGEYDAERFNGALRVVPFPRSWVERGYPVAQASVMATEGEGIAVAVGLRMPLDRSAVEPAAESAGAPDRIAESDDLPAALARLGLENIAVSHGPDGAFILEYENRVYNQSELDGLAVVLREAARRAPAGTDRVRAVIKSHDVPLYVVEVPVSDLEAPALDRSLTVAVRAAAAGGSGTATAESSRGRIDLVGIPRIENEQYTESAVYTARYLFTPELRARLFRGTAVDFAVEIPIWQDSRYRFIDGELPDPAVDRLAVRHFRRLPTPTAQPLWMEWSAGRLTRQKLGIRQQSRWIPGNGRLALDTDLALVGDSVDAVEQVMALASAEISVPERGLLLRVTGGRFLQEDWGLSVALSRFFGDTQLSLLARHSQIASQVGLGVSIPLSSRRDLSPGPVRPRMTSAWEDQVLQTVRDERNPILRTVATEFPSRHRLSTHYFDRGRATPLWIQQRLRDRRHWRP